MKKFIQKSIVYKCGVFTGAIFALFYFFSESEAEEVQKETRSETFFALTHASYEKLDDYYSELLLLLDEYQYRKDSFPIEKLIALFLSLVRDPEKCISNRERDNLGGKVLY